MHIFFSGVGGAGIGPLALIAHQAGYKVSCSDKQSSTYVSYLESKGLQVEIGQDGTFLDSLHAKYPIDWYVYSSALEKENSEHPELMKARSLGIKTTKRDEFLQSLLNDNNLQLIAIAGTHGKTTTTAMTIWLLKQLSIPVSYSVGAKLSFGDMGEFDPKSTYFVYEADEYDRNFLQFHPSVSIISGIAFDHPDIYPTKLDYNKAFLQFMKQTEEANGSLYCYKEDLEYVGAPQYERELHIDLLSKSKLVGEVNRKDALLVANAIAPLCERSVEELFLMLDSFPGLSRRFEKIVDTLYSDYAHTPEKILGALQVAHEVAGENVVVIYEGLHNTRQHLIKKQLATLFKGVHFLIIVPSYLAREDTSLELLTPEKLARITKAPDHIIPAQLDDKLKHLITEALEDTMLVLCLSAGGGGSLDEWIRREFASNTVQ